LGRALPPPPDLPMTLNEVLSASKSARVANEVNPDPTTALASCAAVMMALYSRDQSGEGQYIESTMIGANLYANADEALFYEGKPDRMLTDEGYNGLHALYRMYKAKEGWVFLACPEEKEWQAAAKLLGVGQFAGDDRFCTQAARLEHDEALTLSLREAFLDKTASEWQRLLTAGDVACVQVFDGTMGKFMDETPFVREAGFIAEVEHPSLGRYWRHGPPHTFSETPGTAGPNSYLGEHTRSILGELGYSDDAIEGMEAAGIAVYTDPKKAVI